MDRGMRRSLRARVMRQGRWAATLAGGIGRRFRFGDLIFFLFLLGQELGAARDFFRSGHFEGIGNKCQRGRRIEFGLRLAHFLCLDLFQDLTKLVGGSRLGVFLEQRLHLALRLSEIALRLPCAGGEEMNNGSALVLMRMHLMGGCNHAGIIVVRKFRVGQCQLQLDVKRSQRGSLAQRFFRGGKLLERQIGAPKVQVGVRHVVVERDGFGELTLRQLVLAEIEIGGAERVMCGNKLRIDGDGIG